MRKKILTFIAAGLGSGFSPWAPGTMGSLVALLSYVLWLQHSISIFIGVFAVVAAAGFYATAQLLKGSRIQDPGWIVIDEILGQWLTLLAISIFMPVPWYQYLAALALFRFFDIKKPLGIRHVENLQGAWGVIGDDLLAGVYAFLILMIWNLII
jgi:phosphatidylglycerophosphatase A